MSQKAKISIVIKSLKALHKRLERIEKALIRLEGGRWERCGEMVAESQPHNKNFP